MINIVPQIPQKLSSQYFIHEATLNYRQTQKNKAEKVNWMKKGGSGLILPCDNVVFTLVSH